MKILIITSHIGKSAPGIVFERLISGLSLFHEIHVITAHHNTTLDLSNVKCDVVPKTKLLSVRIQKFLFTMTGINPTDVIWVKDVLSRFKKERNFTYDLIFSFASFGEHQPIMAGRKISLRNGVPHFVYCVDAIPAPIGWLKDDRFFRKTRTMIIKNLADVDALFSANEKMLKYQLNLVKFRKKIISGVIYNPSYGGLKKLKAPYRGENVFLYTGGIYGPRKPDFVLGAFKMLLQTHPNSVLEFVGSSIPEDKFHLFTAEERPKIIVHNFVTNLEPFYERCTALLDIDSTLQDDIYLSSKITNYITIDRPIICETGASSPSRLIFSGIPSIIQCGHSTIELAKAMGDVIERKNSYNFNDRAKIIEMFKLEKVVNRLNQHLSKAI